MSQENLDLVRQAIDAHNRRDIQTTLALFHRDAEVDWSRSRGPLKGTYRGHAGLQSLLDEFWGTFDQNRLEVHGLVDAGSEVLVANTAHIRGRDGVEVIARSTFVYTVQNGQITRFRMFQDHADALEAVGLRQ